MRRDQGVKCATFHTMAEMARLIRPRLRRRKFPDIGGYFPDHDGYGAIFHTKAETARPRMRRRDQGGDGAVFQIKVETAQLPRPRRRLRDQGGDGATKEETARLSRSRPRLRVRGGDGATKKEAAGPYQIKAETAQISRPRRDRRLFRDKGESEAIFQTFFPDFPDSNSHTTMQFGSKSGWGATLDANHVQTIQTLCKSFQDSNSGRDIAICV